MNKTALAYALTIIMAESVLKLVPSGTHDFNQYIAPKALMGMLERTGLKVDACRGMGYNPLTSKWFLFDPAHPLALEVNYILSATKPHSE
jgi:2-polyprenyl-6-hydroxyphenyl methylase/3-demethylubiquinone-9 3-methyltransferase